MKFFTTIFLHLTKDRTSRRNTLLLSRFLGVLALVVLAYSVIFHYLMALEGREFSWATGIYWTLTVMSTLGFGDITFGNDAGRMFSVFVLLSGMIFLLVLLPFTFMEFFYAPWTRAQERMRAPRKVSPHLSGHVILTRLDAVTRNLIRNLNQYNRPYVVVLSDVEEALRLYDENISVMVGNLDSPQTYRSAKMDTAAMLVATGGDAENTNIAFTAREMNAAIPIVTTAVRNSSVDILQLAGSSHVVELGRIMGESLARRTIGGDAIAHIIGRFDALCIAEAMAAGTPLVGKSLAQAKLREILGVTVVGVWERGKFATATPETIIGPNTVLIIAGNEEQIRGYDAMFCIYHNVNGAVIIVGSGKVGRSAALAFQARGVDYKIVEKLPERVPAKMQVVVGDASDIEVLREAGIDSCPAVVITTHDDDVNIYLSIYLRKLRPDMQIISRSTHERNVSTLHRAGADFVMSYASMGANAILNVLRRDNLLMLAEGLNVFRVVMPQSLQDSTLATSGIRSRTECNVVALVRDGKQTINPEPHAPLKDYSEIILIGTIEAEEKFHRSYH